MDFRELARLFRRGEIMDVDTAASYMGMRKVSLEQAAGRRTIGYVQLGAKKLFTKADCDRYVALANRGRRSELTIVEPEVIDREEVTRR